MVLCLNLLPTVFPKTHWQKHMSVNDGYVVYVWVLK